MFCLVAFIVSRVQRQWLQFVGTKMLTSRTTPHLAQNSQQGSWTGKVWPEELFRLGRSGSESSCRSVRSPSRTRLRTPSEAKENALSSVIADETDRKALFAWPKRNLNLQVLILESAKFLNETSDRLPPALPSMH